MNIKPMAAPSGIQTFTTSNNSAARDKAISTLTQDFSQSSQPGLQKVVQEPIQQAQPEMPIETPEQGQEAVIEAQAPTEAPKVEAQEETALSRQFAQLARQEKNLRARVLQQEQAFKAREAALAAKEQQFTAQKPDMSSYYTRDQVKADALKVLSEAGVSYDDITQQMISQQSVDPRLMNTIDQLKQQIQELKNANEATKQSQSESQTQAYQAAVKQIETDARNLVKADPITYEAIHKTGTIKEVVKLIEETYSKDGVLLSVEEAAQQVEDYLVEENYRMASKIDKIKKRMQPAAQPAPVQTAQTPAAQQPKQTQPMKTLTNATSSTRQLSAKERAILAFRNELKS